jgi:hypothetical protein
MTNKFTFREEDAIENKDITFVVNYDDGTPWPNVLQDFLFFLEATGYVGVRDKVRIEYSPFREEGWIGDYYDSEEEKEGRATGWGEDDK